jgi:hypothetical protein
LLALRAPIGAANRLALSVQTHTFDVGSADEAGKSRHVRVWKTRGVNALLADRA